MDPTKPISSPVLPVPPPSHASSLNRPTISTKPSERQSNAPHLNPSNISARPQIQHQHSSNLPPPPHPSFSRLSARRQSATVFTSISESANDHDLWSGALASLELRPSNKSAQASSNHVLTPLADFQSDRDNNLNSTQDPDHPTRSTPTKTPSNLPSTQSPHSITSQALSAGLASPGSEQQTPKPTTTQSPRTPILTRPSTDTSPHWLTNPLNKLPALNLSLVSPSPHAPTEKLSNPYTNPTDEASKAQSPPSSSSKGWSAVRSKLISNPSSSVPFQSPSNRKRSESAGLPSTVIGLLRQPKPSPVSQVKTKVGGAELTAELTTGLLPVIMLKMAMDRDEHGQHRIPILMNYLKLKITDSIHPFHATHAVFRIELEYGDRLLKWVIYRELRDFVNLHAAYKASTIVSRNSNDVSLPAFPKTSLPYFNLLKREGKAENKIDFARIQRESLEDYLLKLTKATMFVPEANRLCKFLEISALSLALANRGGFQGKQGYLRIMSNGTFSRRKRGGFHPLDWKERRAPKWFIVRESYLICVDEPDQTEVYDIFLVDDEFQLKRPKNLLKQGIHLLDWHDASKEQNAPPIPSGSEVDPSTENPGRKVKHKYKGKRRSMSVPDLEASQGLEDPNDPDDPSGTELWKADPKQLQNASSHVFYIVNSEREVKLTAKNERQMEQFIASIERMVARSIWSGKNRFDSYAPIRMNVSAQWLIDGRDYFWNLSKAILLAKERIYIHDWWLSPELYLRRPPAQNQKWRLDRLLQRKANEGVQIFVIVYKEVSNGFTPVESGYTKSRLLSLSPNIHMQRSPSHTGTGNLLWSHHEKLCVIDETIAFMGGLDLCFGRWDSPGHVLIDDAPGGLEFIENFDLQTDNVDDSQIWPGKDYSNQRVSDFFNLARPDEDMYDRDRVPRQPWHDIGLQLVGQPARDLCRHFVQRWNYLLRTKNHTRLMPFLIPPSDFTPLELSERRIIGTCEAQICRSCGPWSIGTPSKIEHSIQTAYVKAIELSDHFVYIENQFFITSCIVESTVITNQIGDALVNRIIRARAQGTAWKAIIVIPTMPGYPSPLNEDAAGSVRLIVECQNKSICRGDTSIFSRLRAEGIDPNEYITFFSLRGWGKLKTGQLTTEGVYIHAKAMIVDDRLVIIGSANINERSQRGDRDSELACVVRDTDMMDSMMGGKPYKVGRFAHTMRVRLMREHLGVDVDALEAEEANMELMEHQREVHEGKAEEQRKAELGAPLTTQVTAKSSTSMIGSGMWDPDREQRNEGDVRDGVTHLFSHRARAASVIKSLGHDIKDKLSGHKPGSLYDSMGGSIEGPVGKASTNKLVTEQARKNPEVAEGRDGSTSDEKVPASKLVKTLEEKLASEQPLSAPSSQFSQSQDPLQPPNGDGREQVNTEPSGPKERFSVTSLTSDADRTGSTTSKSGPIEHLSPGRGRNPSLSIGEPQPIPDESTDSHTHTHSRLTVQAQPNHDFLNSPPPDPARHFSTKKYKTGLNTHRPAQFTISAPRVEIDPYGFTDPLAEGFFDTVWLPIASRNTQILRKVFKCVPDDNVKTWQAYKEYQAWENRHSKPVREEGNGGPDDEVDGPEGSEQRAREVSATSTAIGSEIKTEQHSGGDSGPTGTSKSRKKSVSKAAEKKAQADEGFSQTERDQMEEMLKEIQGHLVLFPTRFMESEDLNNNFLFQKDRIPPLAIYN